MKRIRTKIHRRHLELIKITLLALVLTLFTAGYSLASNFNVKPIKLYFDPQTRIEKLTLTNGGDKDCIVQIKVLQWTQDEKGQELYQETKDILIYPKIATIKKDEEKIVRIGTNLKPGLKEKTYRIYVEEIPSGEKEENTGSSVRIFLKIGVPLFISPVKKEEKGSIETVTLQKGKAEIKVTNQGSQHFVVSGVQVRGLDNQGKEIFSKELSGWYLLSGASRIYETNLPKEICKEVDSLNVEVKTNKENLNFQERLQVQKTMCGQSI